MNLAAWLARLDRVQRSWRFKVAASVLVVLLGLGVSITYWVTRVSHENEQLAGASSSAAAQPGTSEVDAVEPVLPPAVPKESGPGEIGTSSIDVGRQAISELFAFRSDPTSVAVGAGLGTALALVVIWIELGLTYLALVLAGACLALPMFWLAQTTTAIDWGAAGTLSFIARMLTGVAALVAVFTALMRGLQFLFSGSGPILAIARTVLMEAVRIKVSLVLIVMLVLMLAALPDLMNDTTPLRHRMQSFLTYGTAGPFWIIALLTVLFAAATVAFEQRDKQIWQTMTKPVASWQYVLGKWLGVMGLSAVLLGASAGGVFLFVEYLRAQPAQGETVRTLGSGSGTSIRVSEDRLILERQILAARVAIAPDPGRTRLDEDAKTIEDPEFQKIVSDYIASGRLNDPNFAMTNMGAQKVRDDLYTQYIRIYRSIAPGQLRTFVFSGLAGAENEQSQLILKYKIEAGTNDPSDIYNLCFSVNGLSWMVRKTGLSVTQSVPIAPFIIDGQRRSVIPFDSPAFARLIQTGLAPGQRLVRASDLIDKETGAIELTVLNGLAGYTESGEGVVKPNKDMFGFPPNGLELSYSVGSWRMNFMRALLILWGKLAFLAMLAITAATFLSFPVACLIAVGTFLAAESSGFLTTTLESYDAVNRDGSTDYLRVPIVAIAEAVTWTFQNYADLAPTEKLSDGRLLSWGSVARGLGILGAWSILLYGVAVLIFRRRELATYSGQ